MFDLKEAKEMAQDVLEQNPYSVHPAGMADVLLQACNEIERLHKAFLSLKMGHSTSNGCTLPLIYNKCTCGANDLNKRIDNILEKGK